MKTVRAFAYIALAVVLIGVACSFSAPQNSQPIQPFVPRDVTPIPNATRNPNGVEMEPTIQAYQQIGCPSSDSPVHYTVNSPMRGLGFGCDGNASWWQTGKSSKVTLLLWSDGTDLHWQFPSGWECTNTFGATTSAGKKALTELFPNGTITMGTSIFCYNNGVTYQAIYYIDYQWK